MAHPPSKPLSACMVCSAEGRTVSGRVPPGGERAIYPVHMRCLIKWEDRFASFVQKEHHLCQPRRSSGGKLKCPSSSLRSSFQVGIFSHERGKHLSFTVRRSGAILPRNPLRTFHQLLLFCSVASPAPPVLAARESHVQDLLACAGMAVNNHPPSILITRSSCLVLQVRPRSDLDGLGAAVISAAGCGARARRVLARRVLHIRQRSWGLWATPLHERSRRALFDGTLVRSRARCLSLCACASLVASQSWCVIE